MTTTIYVSKAIGKALETFWIIIRFNIHNRKAYFSAYRTYKAEYLKRKQDRYISGLEREMASKWK